MRTLVVVLGLTLITGCKAKAKDEPQTGSNTASAVAPVKAADAGPGSGGSGGSASSTVQLPKSSGTAPNKTTKPLDADTAAKLDKLDFPEFTKDVRSKNGAVEIRYKTISRPRLGATIDASKCNACVPMELDKWKANTEALKASLVPEELRKRPDTIFEVGETELNGAKLIYTYQVGHFFGKDDQGNMQGTLSNAYALYWNDGINQIRVVAEYKDDALPREDLLKVAPRGDLEKLAKSYLDAFTHAW